MEMITEVDEEKSTVSSDFDSELYYHDWSDGVSEKAISEFSEGYFSDSKL